MRNLDVFGKLGYEPTPRQALFHAATEFDVLIGGAAGGGKTRALLMDDLQDAIRHPGIRIGAFRRTYGELKESLLAELAAVDFASELGATWNGGQYELRFPNGSLIMYRYAETLKQATRRQGGQYQKLTFDERNLTPPEVVAFLESRLRSGRAEVPVVGVRSGTNPGGPGHGASKVRYIEPTNYGEHTYLDERGRSVRFVPSKLSDNPYVNAEYAQDLQALPEKLRRAFLDGDWDVFAGQVYCYDTKVEILTSSGWKFVAAVKVGEKVATLSPERELTFEPATAVWHFPYSGDLHVHEGRSVDFAVTAGHKMWAYGRRASETFRLIPVESLPNESVHLRTARWAGAHADTVTIRAPHSQAAPVVTGKIVCRICLTSTPAPHRRGWCEPCYRVWIRGGRPADLDSFRRSRLNPVERHAHKKEYLFDRGDWCELLGWYLSEGFTTIASSGSRYAGRLYGFGISQVADPAKIERIRQLLTRMNLAFTFDGRRFRVNGRVLGAYFEQFGHHEDKFIPREVLGWTAPHLRRLFESLMAGDGCRVRKDRADAWLYATTSRQLADDVQELCLRVGRVATISKAPPANDRSRPCYRVSVYQSDHDRSIVRTSNIRIEPYVGMVACVTVEPHHTVFVRRNGKAMWSGNSEWRHERHTVAPMVLPAGWRRYNGIDWGYAAPWCVLWAAVDEDGRVWVYRELYATGVGEADQARRILAAESGNEQMSARFADDAMWATRGEAKPIADVYSENGVFLTAAGKGAGSRVNGWQRIHSYLADGPACPHHRALGWDTCPMLHVFTTCENLIRTLPVLPHATSGDPEDADTNAEDHAPDGLRYMLINLGSEPSWVFPADNQAAIIDGPPDPNAADPAAAPVTVPNIGGFPIMYDSGSPWGSMF